MNLLQNDTFTILNKALNTASLRQNVISNNVANINTPGFKRSFVNFEDELKEAIGKKDGLQIAANEEGHMMYRKDLSKIGPQKEQDKVTSLRQDGNNVDINMEMAENAMNTINYNFAISRVSGKIATLRYAINDGRR